MAKQLNGLELQGFIKERQLRQVRNLRQEHKITPKLLIVKSPSAGPVIDTYVRMKVAYAADIFIEVEVATVAESDMKNRIAAANIDSSITRKELLQEQKFVLQSRIHALDMQIESL